MEEGPKHLVSPCEFQSPHGEVMFFEKIWPISLGLQTLSLYTKRDVEAATKTERRGEILSSSDQAIRSTRICGPIELKFGRRVHNSRL